QRHREGAAQSALSGSHRATGEPHLHPSVVEFARQMNERFWGALALAMSAGLLLAATEVGYVLGTAGASLEGVREVLPFCGEVAALLLAASVVLGLGQAVVASGATLVRERFRGVLYAAVLSPAYIVFAVLVFRGPRARTIPGHALISALVVLTG